jgi:hypothetical protein
MRLCSLGLIRDLSFLVDGEPWAAWDVRGGSLNNKEGFGYHVLLDVRGDCIAEITSQRRISVKSTGVSSSTVSASVRANTRLSVRVSPVDTPFFFFFFAPLESWDDRQQTSRIGY